MAVAAKTTVAPVPVPVDDSLATHTAQITMQAEQLAKMNEIAEQKLQEQARAIAIANQEAKLKHQELEKQKLLNKVKEEEQKLKDEAANKIRAEEEKKHKEAEAKLHKEEEVEKMRIASLKKAKVIQAQKEKLH